MRQEADRAKRKLETELQDVKEQLVERRAQVEELQIVLSEYFLNFLQSVIKLQMHLHFRSLRTPAPKIRYFHKSFYNSFTFPAITPYYLITVQR